MKNILKISSLFFAMVLFLTTSCQDDTLELGETLPADKLDFQIIQNADDPNMIILESLTPGVTPLWQTPMGRSTRVVDTVKIPFAGEYNFVYGVLSAGGYVQADTFKLTLTTDNLNYVNDPLWTLLSGGVGNEKTWILDLDENGVSKYFAGPLYFYGTGDSWTSVEMMAKGVARADVNEELGLTGDTGWNWNPDWKGNTWLMPAGDYGTMTFDLKGNAHITVDHKMLGKTESGTYFLDVNAKTLKLTDASPLHDENRDGQVIDWGDLKVMSITENTLQLAALRDEDLSGEGPALFVYNYISKEYADNWVPEDQPDPEPPYNGDANTDLTTNVSTSKTWRVDVNYPYNWHNLAGEELNEVASTADEPGGFAFTTWTPPYDAAVFESIKMILTKGGENDGSYVFEISGDTFEGTYTVDEKNNIDFGQPIQFVTNMGGWLNISTTAENTLRVIKVETDALGNVEGLWLGQRATDKDEYISLHFKAVADAGGGADPEGTEVAFDNSKLVVGDLEDNGNLRLELYNDFGSTKANPPLDPASVVFNNRLEIKFTLQGISFADGAAGSYNTAIGLADADWSAQYWGDGPGEVAVTGDGSYTVYCEPGSSFETALVFVVDIKGIAADVTDLSSVTATIDSIVLY